MSQIHALIIDDNAKNLRVLSKLMSFEGATCTEVADPKRLAAVLENIAPVDVIFLDLEIPGTDGFKLLQSLKADARFQAVPIVAYTVHLSELNVARKAGFDSFLGKPLDSERFPDQLNRILKGESVWETT